MNLEPGQSYGLSDRFMCGKCGEQPRMLSAKSDGGAVSVKLQCHGEVYENTFTKQQLSKTITVFSDSVQEDLSYLIDIRK